MATGRSWPPVRRPVRAVTGGFQNHLAGHGTVQFLQSVTRYHVPEIDSPLHGRIGEPGGIVTAPEPDINEILAGGFTEHIAISIRHISFHISIRHIPFYEFRDDPGQQPARPGDFPLVPGRILRLCLPGNRGRTLGRHRRGVPLVRVHQDTQRPAWIRSPCLGTGCALEHTRHPHVDSRPSGGYVRHQRA